MRHRAQAWIECDRSGREPLCRSVSPHQIAVDTRQIAGVKTARRRFELIQPRFSKGTVGVADAHAIHILSAAMSDKVQDQRHQDATSCISSGALASAR